MRHEEQKTWEEIAEDTVNLAGNPPSLKAVRNAVARVHQQREAIIPTLGYGNCGRHRHLTEKQEKEVVAFVTKWRHKRFCTCSYIKRHLRLKVSSRTLQRTLKRHGFRWRSVPKKIPLTPEHLAKRQEFVDKYGDKSAAWWEANMNLVLDGVTLTKPRKDFVGDNSMRCSPLITSGFAMAKFCRTTRTLTTAMACSLAKDSTIVQGTLLVLSLNLQGSSSPLKQAATATSRFRKGLWP